MSHRDRDRAYSREPPSYRMHDTRSLPPRDDRRRSPLPIHDDDRYYRPPPSDYRGRDAEYDRRRYEDDRRPHYDDYPPTLDRRDYGPSHLDRRDYGPPPMDRRDFDPRLRLGPPSRYMDDYDDRRDLPPSRLSPMPPHASSSKSTPKPMAPPNSSVIFLGLPETCDNDMLRVFLEQMGCAIDSCTVIYDKTTNQSKRFGFARFASVEHARAFVEHNYPYVVWRDKSGRGLPEDDGLKLKIDFSTTDKPDKFPQMRPPPAKANVPLTAADTVNAGLPTKPAPASNLPPNDGTRDIGPVPHNTLLLRGLDPLTRESEIADALAKLPGTAQGVTVRQVMHIKDRSNKGSLGFAFVAYKDAKVAADVLGKIWDPEANPQGWRIRGHAVTVTFAHNESFRPAYAVSSWSFRNEAGKELLYWDERAFVSSWTPSIREKLAAGKISIGSNTSTTSGVDEADEFLASFGAPDPAPVSAASQEASTAATSTAASPDKSALTNGTNRDRPGDSKSVMLTPRDASDRSSASPEKAASSDVASSVAPTTSSTSNGIKKEKKAPELIASKKAAPNIAKWNEKQSELHGSLSASKGADSTKKRKLDEATTTTATAAPVDDGFPHGDPARMICLLCQRQFGKIEDLTRHDELSNLHRTNLANSELVQAAEERKRALQAEPQYRDRAAERRQAFNQPDKPDTQHDSKKHRKEPGPSGAAALPSVSASEAAQGIKESNIGHKMLAAAGWKEGEGLGSNGRAEAPQAKIYASGAGLGADSGVDAAQAGDAWNAPSTGREKARRRFQEHP